MIIDGKLVISKKKKKDLIVELKQKGFKAFPKVAEAARAGEDAPVVEDEEEDEDVELESSSYDYLLGVCISGSRHWNKANINPHLDASVVSYARTSREIATPNRR